MAARKSDAARARADRPPILGLLCAGLAGVLALVGGVGRPQPPAAEACLEIGIYSNGFHSSLTAPREALTPDHPLRRLFPAASWFAAGWGDEDFFRAPEGGSFAQGVHAALPGGATVIQAIGLDEPPGVYFGPETTPQAAVRAADAAALGLFLKGEIAPGPDGGAIIIAPGHHPGRSYFLRAKDRNFSIFNNCNHWAARGLRAVGLPITGALTGRDLLAQMKRIEAKCPDD